MSFLLCGWPRTVLGCLVACCGPVRRPGLGAFQQPGPSWGGRFPWCRLSRRFGPGPRPGWPGRILRSGQVPVRAAPGPVALPASADHQCGCMVTGEVFMMLPQRCEPVLSPPARRVGRIYDYDAEARVSGHLHEAVTELRRGDTSDQVTVPPAALAAGRPVPGVLAALGALGGEVQVLDHDRLRAVLLRRCGQYRDRGPQPPVPGRRWQPRQLNRDGERGALRRKRGTDRPPAPFRYVPSAQHQQHRSADHAGTWPVAGGPSASRASERIRPAFSRSSCAACPALALLPLLPQGHAYKSVLPDVYPQRLRHHRVPGPRWLRYKSATRKARSRD